MDPGDGNPTHRGRDFTVRDHLRVPILSGMPETEERIDAVEREIAGIRSDVRLQNAMLIKCGEQMSDLRVGQHELQKGQDELYTITTELRTGQDELRRGQDELRKGQDELRSITDDLRRGQDDLRTITEDLRKGQDDLRTITEDLRKGQDDLRADTAAIRQTLEEFRGAFAVVLDEIQIQKAWREEFSDKLARVVAKSEGLDA